MSIPALIVVSFLAATSIAFLSHYSLVNFELYFGPVSPALATLGICSFGIIALFTLRNRFGFQVWNVGFSSARFLLSAGLAIPFMLSATIADVFLGFPPDINVAIPAALLFYPVIAYVAQLALHVVPLAIVASVLSFLCKSWSVERRIWSAIVLVATFEAVYQVLLAVPRGDSSLLITFVAAQLFAFGLVEFYLFRRFDYASMYVFRLTYYAYWHITWGWYRLEWIN